MTLVHFTKLVYHAIPEYVKCQQQQQQNSKTSAAKN